MKLRLVLVTLAVLAMTLPAGAEVIDLEDSPFEIRFNARINETALEYGWTLDIQSLIGADAQAYGSYHVYGDSNPLDNLSFDTRAFEPVSGWYPFSETVDGEGLVFCAVVDIRFASVLGVRMERFERIHTRCLRITAGEPDPLTSDSARTGSSGVGSGGAMGSGSGPSRLGR